MDRQIVEDIISSYVEGLHEQGFVIVRDEFVVPDEEIPVSYNIGTSWEEEEKAVEKAWSFVKEKGDGITFEQALVIDLNLLVGEAIRRGFDLYCEDEREPVEIKRENLKNLSNEVLSKVLGIRGFSVEVSGEAKKSLKSIIQQLRTQETRRVFTIQEWYALLGQVIGEKAYRISEQIFHKMLQQAVEEMKLEEV